MYEDILELVTIAARKRNLKDSTIHSYRQSLKHFFNSTDKSWKELTIPDADEFLTCKRLGGIMPETYNHYYAALRFMYKRVLKLNWDEDEIPRMRRDRSLPTLSRLKMPSTCLFVQKNSTQTFRFRCRSYFTGNQSF